jgi:tetratricopeptide (TPR) repeat protein
MRVRADHTAPARAVAVLLLTFLAGAEVAIAEPASAASAPSMAAAPDGRSVAERVGQPGAEGKAVASADRLTIQAHPTEPLASLPAVESAPAGVYSSQFGAVRLAEEAGFAYDELPGRLADPSLRRLWSEGIDLEQKEKLLESAQRYELIVAAVPEESFTYWRIARNYWRYGEGLAAEAKDERVRFFELAEDWAARGIAVDPQCAACMLWKFVAMGRQATTKGLMTAVGNVREMERMLRQGIELQPEDADFPGNSTLGNLYYAGAVFYRVIPDWFWLKWFVGVRGDKGRALEYIREAVELAPVRVDYQVELGAVLLCLGGEKRQPETVEEGMQVLEAARHLDPFLSTDHLDLSHAKILMDHPDTACGYSRDGFIDLKAVLHDVDEKR